MTRISSRGGVPLREPRGLMQAEGIALEPFACWQPPKGVNYLDPLTRMDKEYASQITNWWLDRGVLKSRFGTTALGASVADLMAVLNFIDGSGVAYLLRFTISKMQTWDGVSWTDVAGVTFTGTTSDYFTFTAFGGKLILSNGVDGIFEYNFQTGLLTKIDGAPACRQLTTFDGRVLASNVLDPTTGSRLPSRVVWSVKNNHLIWPDSGGFTDDQKLGSGFEDLLNTPGGQIDEQRGIWPVTDTIALVVRSRSVWQATTTDNFDAPFAFGRLYDNIGCDSPLSIDTVPGGIIGLFTDGSFYLMSNTEIKEIGAKVKDQILTETTLVTAAGMYDSLTRNYWFANESFVYRYSLIDQGWSRHQYPFQIRQMMHTKSAISGLTIDQLVGTIDGLVGSIDSLVGHEVVVGNFFATTSGYAIKEDDTQIDDADGAGGRIDSSTEIRTGAIQYATALQYQTTLQAHLEFEADMTHDIVVEYSIDKGNSWNTYSLASLTATLGPTVVAFRRTVESKLFQLRITSTMLGKTKIINFLALGQKGRMKNL
jgi:hypothetical protein